MSIYRKLIEFGEKYISKSKLFKYGFNLSPMYKRSTGKLIHVSDDLLEVKIKLPISYKNRNYMNTIFGGSMFAAVDPIPMIQLTSILGKDFVVWDKSAEIFFKRPENQDLYANFIFTKSDIEDIKNRISTVNEIDIIKFTKLTNKAEDTVFCEIHKKVYIANKAFYKQKVALRTQKTS